ncbi:TPA: hypothetical protein QDZ60_000454 [Stenotrophomonas maltophilia]|nr:hypothetical protein [Stenotrophomonas maltophilia]
MIGPPAIEPVISAPGLVNVPQYSLSWSVPANSESFVLEESANGAGWTVVHNGARWVDLLSRVWCCCLYCC